MDAYRVEIGHMTVLTMGTRSIHVIASSIEGAIQAGHEWMQDEYEHMPEEGKLYAVFGATRVLHIDRVAP